MNLDSRDPGHALSGIVATLARLSAIPEEYRDFSWYETEIYLMEQISKWLGGELEFAVRKREWMRFNDAEKAERDRIIRG